MIQATHISKHFGGIHAVRDVSLTCENGSITGIIGPNGSGKSTLINVLTGMLARKGGTITQGGISSRTFQDARVWDNMTIEDVILLAISTRSPIASLFSFDKRRVEVQNILEEVGLEAKKKSETKHLSYGQRKLLEIARARATGASTLFLDEPFAGLSPAMVKTVKGIIQSDKISGKAIILVEHDMSVIRELCDNVYVLDSGEIIAHGTPDEVLDKEEVIASYLGN